MPHCCVPQCTNRSETCPELSFYRFPANKEIKHKWLRLIRRANFTPTCNTRVCSWHFPHGKTDGPSRFAWNIKGTDCPSSEKKGRKHMLREEQVYEAAEALVCLAEDDSSHKTKSKASQTLQETSLQFENSSLKAEVESLRNLLHAAKQGFTFSQIESSVEKIQYFTCLPDVSTVHFLEGVLSMHDLQYRSDCPVHTISLIDQLLLTLMKLRLNLGLLDLATRFRCSTATVTNIFLTIVDALYDSLYVDLMQGNIPPRAKDKSCLPACFLPFPDCRIVLDSIEISVCNTEEETNRCMLHSQSKGKTTLKTLIGVAPNGLITFASDLYGGASDKVIAADCGVLKFMQPGDSILADKGFAIKDLLPEGVSLNIPAFLVNGHFTQEEVVNNRQISVARIHVGRSIQNIKLYSILDHIPYQFKGSANKLLKVCVCLTNLIQNPCVFKVQDRM